MATARSQKSTSQKKKKAKKNKVHTKQIYQRGRIWWISFIDAYGDRRRESSDSTKKQDAENLLVQRLREKVEGTPYCSYKYDPVPLSKLCDDYVKSRAEPATQAKIKTAFGPLVKYFQDTAVHAIPPEQLQKFLDDCRAKGMAVSTIRANHSYFRAALRFGLRIKVLAPKVVLDLLEIRANKQKALPIRYLTVDEVIRILLCSPVWLQPALVVALHTGIRREDYWTLPWEQVDLGNGYVHFPPTKGVKHRDIGLMLWPWNILKRLRLAYPLSSHPFHAGNGKQLGDSRLDKQFRAAILRARLKDVTLHDTRHSFARWAILAGASPVAVQKALGHASLKTTEIYINLESKEITQMIRDLGVPLAQRQVQWTESRFVQLEQQLMQHPKRHLLNPLLFD